MLLFALTSGVVAVLFCVVGAHRRGKGYFVGIKDQTMEGKGWIMNKGTNKNGGGDDRSPPNSTSKGEEGRSPRAHPRVTFSRAQWGAEGGGGGGFELGKR